MARAIDIAIYMIFLSASIGLVMSLNIFGTEMPEMNDSIELSDTAVILNVTDDVSHDPLGVGLFGSVIFAFKFMKDTLFRALFIYPWLVEMSVPSVLAIVINLGIDLVLALFIIQWITNRYFSGVE